MAEEIPKEVILEVKNEMNSTTRRVVVLEYNSVGVQNEVSDRDFTWNKNMSDFRNEIDMLKKEIDSLKINFQGNLNAINNIIANFKDCSKRDALDKFERKLDDMNFEKMVSKKEFMKLVGDNL